MKEYLRGLWRKGVAPSPSGPVALTASAAWSTFESSSRRKRCSAATLAGYRQQWGRFADGLTDRPLAGVTRQEASSYLVALGEDVGANTWNKHLGCLRYVWRVVQSETGQTLPDVWAGIPCATVPLHRHEAFTTEQVRALYAAAEGELRGIIAVAAHTGLRRCDCILLSGESAKLDEGILRVVPRKTKRTGAEAVIGISPLVRGILTDAGAGRVFPDAARELTACSQTWGIRFQRFMVSTLGLNGNRDLYGMHSFRHWFSTQLTEAGVPDRIVNVMMCHGQGTVAARYCHPSSESLREAVSRLPAL